ncbi:arylsulfotransferase family protein [Mycolicibacterium cosmeticum]|uniref:arylsulfotransferase family protein n=1 Tax=Mycolicibacterium cosmeticum TaxID=258533 RepID=UPI001F380757|nr:arylsulfotransferase family protein [Mycolicibacterium cosmeticum]
MAAVVLVSACSATPGKAPESTGSAAPNAAAVPSLKDLAAVAQTQLVAPPLNVTVNQPDGGAGFVFINGGAPCAANLFGSGNPGIPSGPEILDKQGRPVWFLQIPGDQDAMNLQVQTYQGKPVLTWFQGDKLSGADYIADTDYTIIKKITPAGVASDPHEFRLTPDGKALITSVKQVDADLSGIGGPTTAKIADSFVDVIDVASGKTLLSWDSAQHLPVTDSVLNYAQLQGVPGEGVLPLHVNSAAPDPDGNMLVSVRSANELVDVNMQTGAINWKLGGKKSDFTLGPGVNFAGQHDATFVDDNTIMFFNNNVDLGGKRHGPSSIMWIRLDRQAKTATLLRNWVQPQPVDTFTQGSAQALPNGNTFSGWGDANHITEFAPDGRIVWNATQPITSTQQVGTGPKAMTVGDGTYRAFLQQWSGHPTQKPELTVSNDNGRPTVHAVWNGATDVTQWRVLSGTSPDKLTPVATTAWNGLNTPVVLPAGTATTGNYFTIEALDKTGAIIGSSNPTKI